MMFWMMMFGLEVIMSRVRRWSHGGDGNDDMGQWGDTVVTCHVSGVQGDHISMSQTVSRMSQHFKHKHSPKPGSTIR